jgi:hypothetical protein
LRDHAECEAGGARPLPPVASNGRELIRAAADDGALACAGTANATSAALSIRTGETSMLSAAKGMNRVAERRFTKGPPEHYRNLDPTMLPSRIWRLISSFTTPRALRSALSGRLWRMEPGSQPRVSRSKACLRPPSALLRI